MGQIRAVGYRRKGILRGGEGGKGSYRAVGRCDAEWLRARKGCGAGTPQALMLRRGAQGGVAGCRRHSISGPSPTSCLL